MKWIKNLTQKKLDVSQRKIFSLSLFVILVIQALLIFYFQQEQFRGKYDASYWKERFEYSQWALPLSTRPISDDILFAYIGNELIHGMDPTLINVETPPLGKYLIGLSILIFNNPVFFGLIATITAFFLSLILFSKVLKDRLDGFLLTIIVFLDPLMFSQSWLYLLDMVQLVFLLANMLAMYMFIKKNRYLYSVIAGVSLGFFFGIKFPVLFPVIFAMESFYFLFLSRKYLKFVAFLASILIAILIPYFRFFVLGNTIIDFLRIEKFIINFYSSSTLEVNIGAVWTVILTGNFPDLVSGALIRITEWSLMWPIILVLSALSALSILTMLKKKKTFLIGISIYVFSALAIYTFIPFYPRYFILVLPFIYLLAFYFIRDRIKNLLLFIPIITICFLNFFMYSRPDPNKTLDPFIVNISNQNFQDIYVQNLAENKPISKRSEFQKISKDALRSANIEYATVKILGISKISENKLKVNVQIKYFTRYLGDFSENKSFYMIKENSKWKVKWDWDIILNGFEPGYSIRSDRNVGKRGSIIGSDGEVLVEDKNGYIFSVNSSLYDATREDEMLALLSSIIDQSKVGLQNAYLTEEKNNFIDVGTSFKPVSLSKLEYLRGFKGLEVRESPARIYHALSSTMIGNTFYPECCSRIYSSSLFRGVEKFEKKYDARLRGQDGGNIEIIDGNGKLIRKVFERKKIDGEDVVI